MRLDRIWREHDLVNQKAPAIPTYANTLRWRASLKSQLTSSFQNSVRKDNKTTQVLLLNVQAIQHFQPPPASGAS